ncbi:hypothetical protein CEE45_03495 [Candidatus Heimdallarchaeota archaeon B3_Heim]|nr:MAG: hypothetical protein CEE45_03495 [Candidatus Heimdallarchaeota archaeon B3_Heim]
MSSTEDNQDEQQPEVTMEELLDAIANFLKKTKIDQMYERMSKESSSLEFKKFAIQAFIVIIIILGTLYLVAIQILQGDQFLLIMSLVLGYILAKADFKSV